jgi:hypothetical protein
MTWERALEADARLAAKNAVLIRAALRQSFDPERAFIGYQSTTPDDSLTLPQQRSRARSWAVMNIRPNLEPLRQVLYKIWAEAYALGDTAAREAITQAREAQKADAQGTVDWSKWKPGDAAQAIILKPPRAFQRLLTGAGITLKGFSDTTLTDIGNAIGEAIELGLDAKRSAKLIGNHVASPARALTIAITEQNRAISAATQNRYLDAGLKEQEWLVFEPCVICAKNAGQKVSIGAPFPSGDTQPPAHPNCRCALAPVIPGFDDDMPGVGSTAVSPTIPTVSTPAPTPTPVIEEVVVAAQSPNFVPGQWNLRNREELREEIVDRIHKLNPAYTRERIVEFVNSSKLNPTDKNILKNGVIYKNGPVEVRFYATGAKIPDAKKKELLKLIEKLQATNPVAQVAINIGSTSTRKYGWAEIGGGQMWITPKTVLTDSVPKVNLEQKFKMPVLNTHAQRDYTLTHEWGHLIDFNPNPYGGAQNAATSASIARIKREFPDAFKSEYSGKNSKEFFAEMFTEWYLSGGKTDNALVQAMAKEFKWKV